LHEEHVTFSSLIKRTRKHKGKQKMSNSTNTTQPLVGVTFLLLGGSVDPQNGQRN
jgi:hypothetical protein